MKVTLVFEDLDVGGGQKYGVELANYLYSNDVEISIAYGESNIFWKNLHKEIPLYKFRQSKRKNLFTGIHTIIWFLRLFKRNQTELIHYFSYGATVFASIAAKISGIPTVYTPMSVEARGLLQRLQYKKYGPLFTLLDSLTTKYIALSDYLFYEYNGIRGVAPSKIETVWLGVDIEKYNKEESLTKANAVLSHNSEFIFVTVGRFHWLKRLDLLLKAFAIFKRRYNINSQTKFIIIGDGELREDLENLVMDLGVQDNILFLGMQENIHELLPLCSIYLCAGINPNLGLAVQEALACGLPVITLAEKSDHRLMAQDCCIEGHNGFLPCNIEEMAERMYALYSNTSRRLTYGLNSRILAETRFDIRIHNSSVKDLYEELMAP